MVTPTPARMQLAEARFLSFCAQVSGKLTWHSQETGEANWLGQFDFTRLAGVATQEVSSDAIDADEDIVRV